MRLFVTLFILVAVPSFSADARWGLRWRAPDECISAADLSARVQERLARPVFALNPDFRVDGVLEAGTSPRWKARLTVVSAAGEVMGTREVTGDEADCRALDGRLAFIVAMSIDSKASEKASPPLPPPVAAAPPPARVDVGKGSVWVELESDDPEAVLYRHVGTTYGSVGTQGVVITTISKECMAPCAQFIEQPRSDFFISGRGISLSDTFSLVSNQGGLKIKVKTGSAALRALGWTLVVLSVSTLAVGIPFLILGAGNAQPVPGVQNPYGGTNAVLGDLGLGMVIGGGAALLGSIPMIAFSSTKVEFFPIPAAPAVGRPNISEI